VSNFAAFFTAGENAPPVGGFWISLMSRSAAILRQYPLPTHWGQILHPFCAVTSPRCQATLSIMLWCVSCCSMPMTVCGIPSTCPVEKLFLKTRDTPLASPRRSASAYITSNASEDLPLPLGPQKTCNLECSSSNPEISRLLTRILRSTILSDMESPALRQ